LVSGAPKPPRGLANLSFCFERLRRHQSQHDDI
jgi:hypothetical protein